MSIRLIAAVGTPLTSDESLHVEGLDAHLDDQWRHGMTGCLIGGTMGTLQLLTEQTYRDLVTHGVRLAARRGEVLIGVGDAGFARTRDRILCRACGRCIGPAAGWTASASGRFGRK